MTILNVIDADTGKVVAIDLDNPSGTIYVNDANTGETVPIPLTGGTIGGSASGDLSGTYPSPTVEKIGGVTVTVDTDATLSANSDSKLATQKAVKTYADGKVLLTSTLLFTIDGGGSAITTGIKGDLIVDFPCTINSVTMLADQTGTIVVDVWKNTYANYAPTSSNSIAPAIKPTISSGLKTQDTTLTGWTTSISAGDILRFNVNSASVVTRTLVALKVTRT